MEPYGGMKDGARQGFGVDENFRRLHRLLWVERRLVYMAAGWACNAAHWETKQALAKHLWEDAEHMHWLYERGQQLRGSASKLAKCPDLRLEQLLEEALQAPDEVAFLAGIYNTLKPALVANYRRHLAETQPLVDQPTVRLLRFILLEEEEQIEFFQDALAGLLDDDEKRARAAEHQAHLAAWIVACGDLDGTGERPTTTPARRADGSFQIASRPSRDERFTAIEPKFLPQERAQVSRLHAMMRVRMDEMMVVEHLSSILFERPDLPYETVHDLARHTWDEARHCFFGQVALEKEGFDITQIPSAIGDQIWAMRHTPAERFIWLAIHIENGAMKYPPGKRLEYEYCRDEARHPLMTVFQDYDWADEVVHAQFGRRWAPTLMGPGATLEDARNLAERLGREFWQDYVAGWVEKGYSWGRGLDFSG
jgi:hypothetical protein